MTWEYYDRPTTSTDSGNCHDSSNDTTSSTCSYGAVYRVVGGSSDGYSRRCRKVLVEHPEHWSEEDSLEYVNLVNEETETGWRVGMLIKGDIVITDPDIEVRKMRDFVPLLKKRASPEDRAKIDAFFKAKAEA